MRELRDLVIIGGGAAGLVVAGVAARLGLAVTLIEQAEHLGGDCLHFGCVPSKALVHVARVAALLRQAPELGLASGHGAGQVDMQQVNAYVRAVQAHIQRHDDLERFRSLGCEVVIGRARFLDESTVTVNARVIRARRFVIATGSSPAVPPIPGLLEAGYLTNRDLFSLPHVPKRLVVVGGGPMGVEMGQAFARLGSSVTIIEHAQRLLPSEDSELTAMLETSLRDDGIAIHTAATITSVAGAEQSRVIRCSDGREITCDAILIAAGRTPNVEDLGLSAAGVAYGPAGIAVDKRMRTSQRHIYACGDVCGPLQFAHAAEYQAGIILRNAVFRFPVRADYSMIPRVVFCAPELARIGPLQAELAGEAVEVQRISFRDVDRAVTDHTPQGMMKLLLRRGRVVGASIIGAQAGELIHQVALAIRFRGKASDLAQVIHAYPTLSQIHSRAARSLQARRLFHPAVGRFARFMTRLRFPVFATRATRGEP